MLDGITAGTVAASKAVVVDSNKDIASFRNITLTGELDAGSLDVSGDADIDGTLEADAITVGGTALNTVIAGVTVTNATTAAVATTVTISDNESTNEENAVVFTAGGDVDGGNIGLESDGDLTYNPSTGTLTATVFKGNIDAVDGDFDGTLEADAMTLNGTAITTTATLSTGISNGNVPVFTTGVADDDFLRVNSTSIEGRSASEVLSDIGASAVAGSSSIVTTGALNSGSITSGFGAIDNGSSAITTTGVGTFGSLDISGDIDVDGTTNLDAVDIDGAVDMASTLAIAGLTTVSNAIQFNEVAIPSAGEAAIYRRNTDDNLYIQAASVSGSNKGIYILDGGQNAIALFEASEIDLSIDVSLAGFAHFDNAQNTKFYTTNSMATQKAASIPQSVNTQGGELLCAVDAGTCFFINRGRSDGTIADFRRGGTTQGSISISSTTTSYNAFTGSHWSRLTDNSKPTILRGTVMETIDEMCDWYALKFTIPEHTVVNAQGNSTVEIAQDMHISYEKPSDVNVGDTVSYTHEGVAYDATVVLEGDIKHVKSKISDTADCTNVYGVFMDWDNDDDTVNDMYVNAVGTAVVRIHKDQTVAKGDLLTSNGDGTAKKQDDDIIRSKTIGKVLTNIKQETYSDSSYTVPCALYCG
jgi:cytoskeletal protein CcmA (bactofilin family)